MTTSYTEIPNFQLRHNCIMLYDTLHPCPPRRETKIERNRTKAYKGDFSDAAKSRMKKAIDIMIQSNETRIVYNPITQNYFPFRFNFITLTISDLRIRQASECYDKLLKPFLRVIRDKFSCSYIWKLELQRRGQVHYHLTTNKFIEYDFIKSKWNQLQRRAGMLENYAYRYGHYHANSTDVHAVRNIKNWGAYMSKYMSKNVGGKVDGKIWDCSRDLKRNRFSSILDSPTFERICNNMKSSFSTDRVKFFVLDDPTIVLSEIQKEKYADWKNNKTPPPPSPPSSPPPSPPSPPSSPQIVLKF